MSDTTNAKKMIKVKIFYELGWVLLNFHDWPGDFGRVEWNYVNPTKKVFWHLNLWLKCSQNFFLTGFLHADSISAIKNGGTHIRFWDI